MNAEGYQAPELTADRICVLAPAYREEARVGDTVRSILRYCPNAVVVDDGSPDRSGDVAEAAGAKVLRHPENRGKGEALETGFSYAAEQGYSACITLDADGQHDPSHIPEFIAEANRTGCAVLVGNRMDRHEGMPLVRTGTNKLMSGLISRLARQRIPDSQNGYRLYRAEALPHVHARARGFAAESEQLLRLAHAGFRIGSVPIRTIYGEEKSKISPVRDTLRFLRMLWLYYYRRWRPKNSKSA